MSESTTAATHLGIQVFEVLSNCAAFVPVPGVGYAAEIAIKLLEMTLQIKTNTEDFVEIGTKACNIVNDIVERIDKRQHPDLVISKTLTDDIDSLIKDIDYVRLKVKKHSKKRKSVWRKIIYHISDAEVIQECKEKLQDALSTFNLQANIEVRKGMEDLNSKVTNLTDIATLGVAMTQSLAEAEPPRPSPTPASSPMPSYHSASSSQSTASSSSQSFPPTPPADNPYLNPYPHPQSHYDHPNSFGAKPNDEYNYPSERSKQRAQRRSARYSGYGGGYPHGSFDPFFPGFVGAGANVNVEVVHGNRTVTTANRVTTINGGNNNIVISN